jgi:uncharacterized protein (TIGR02118 family)
VIKTIARVHRRPGTSHDEFAHYWVDVHAPLVKPRIPGLRKYVLNVAFQPEDSAEPPEWDGVVELGFDDLASLRAGMSAPDWMSKERQVSSEAFLDMSSIKSFVAEQHVILDTPLPAGAPPRVKLLAFVQRRPGTTHEQFADYWVNTHGPLVKPRIPGLRKYVLNVSFTPADTQAAPDWDGMVELGFDDLASLRAGMSAPDWMSQERQTSSEAFLDLGSTHSLYTTEHIVLG